MIEIASAVSAIAQVSEVISSLSSSVDNAKALSLRNELNKALGIIYDLSRENQQLASENESLRKELEKRKALEYIDGRYYVFKGEEKIGPICYECYMKSGLLQMIEGGRCRHCYSRY